MTKMISPSIEKITSRKISRCKGDMMLSLKLHKMPSIEIFLESKIIQKRKNPRTIQSNNS